MTLKQVSHWLARRLVDSDEIDNIVDQKASTAWHHYEKGTISKKKAEKREENIRKDVDPTDELYILFRGYGKQYLSIAVIAAVPVGILVYVLGFSWGLLVLYGLGLDVLGAAILTKSHFSSQRDFQFSVGRFGGGRDANEFLIRMTQKQREQAVEGMYGVIFLLVGFTLQCIIELIRILGF